MNRRPKEYREQIYSYVEDLLGRPLTFDEHDVLRDMLAEYVFSMSKLRVMVRRALCLHDWKVDKKIEFGDKPRLFVKCIKCDKQTTKKMHMHSARV